MRNIWKIFRSDWQRLTASVVAVVVVMGLCLIPCLYAWFNIFSNWDPYGPDSPPTSGWPLPARTRAMNCWA